MSARTDHRHRVRRLAARLARAPSLFVASVAAARPDLLAAHANTVRAAGGVGLALPDPNPPAGYTLIVADADPCGGGCADGHGRGAVDGCCRRSLMRVVRGADPRSVRVVSV